ncbi:hypothetical protein BJY01DRAFT_214016 [Aspergillus pseudoustus]|uniref:Adenosine deaminase domain-containing protein n=1 Tax=Aspergillus pseudoustus TaxID=1810923 RepID=A0ABR4JZY3_9EURO
MELENISWEAEEGVPQTQDPFIQRFLDGRDSLIQREVSQRHDFNLHNSLPPAAHRACQIVSQVCAQELAQIQHDGYPSNDFLHLSLMSGQAKERLEQSDLWKIVRHLPKGSLLHAHLPAMVDIDFLIDQVFATPGFHISAPKPITSQPDYQDVPVHFHYQPTEASRDKPSLWSPDYTPSDPIDVLAAGTSFPVNGEAGFRTWLKDRCTLQPPNDGGTSGVISDFFSFYLPIINSLFHHEPILRSSLRRILSQLVADRIRYVEFRVAFTFQYTLQGNEKHEEDYSTWFQIFQEEIERFRNSEEGKYFYGARIIWTTMRGLSNKDIGLSMKQCILTKQKFPGLICGFDLFGIESQERSLSDLLPILFWFRGRCADEGLDIPFMFHAGQTLGDGDQTDDNLFDAVLLGSRRISQPLSLYKHPLLIEVIKTKNILLEYSLRSSACLGLTTPFQSHPLPAVLSRGVSVTLGNDSPGVFGLGDNGLSTEYFGSLLAFQNMGLTGLTMMAENSIRWSCYEDQSLKEWTTGIEEGIVGEGLKASRLREFYADFEKFCEWVAQEFGARYGVE